MVFPLLYEINTRCWLRDLSETCGEAITLSNVPEEQLRRWQRLGFSHIWLMGVWASGPRSRTQALTHAGLQSGYADALPGWQEADVGGSPYAISDYHANPTLGGEAGLTAFRERLHAYGLKLILDFVPNHLGLDHPWARERPELFVQNPRPTPEVFAQETVAGQRWLAYGKDPYFPGWTDTVQLDYRLPATRAAMASLLQSVAERCDGVRCDMAMLLLEDVFAKTWERFPISEQIPEADRQTPSPEFWTWAISAIKARQPEFLFLAEVYWGLEGRLRALGFDYTYDKELYNLLLARNAAGTQQHLLGLPSELLGAGAHFLENHDEGRVASALSLAAHRAAALVILGLPGMRFLHDGQLSGARRRLPVQLRRRAHEPVQREVESMYEQLLAALPATAVGRGRGQLLHPHPAWPTNPTAQNFVVVQWQDQPPEFDLVVVNLAPHSSQCYVRLPVGNLAQHDWTMRDLLSAEQHQRTGADLSDHGLYLDLPGHGAQLFRFQPG